MASGSQRLNNFFFADKLSGDDDLDDQCLNDDDDDMCGGDH